MSVDIAGNPWKFAQDGVGTNPNTFTYWGHVYFNDAMITKMTGVGQRIYFTDWAGRTVLDFTADQSNEAFKIARIGKVFGLKCVQFDSGELIVGV